MIGIVLAGGRSSRFGSPKGDALLDGRTLIEHGRHIIGAISVTQFVVVPPERTCENGMLHDREEWRGMGPMAGIATVMDHVESDWYAVIACDTPGLSADVYRALASKIEETRVPVVAMFDGRMQPLVALYPREWRSTFQACLARGERALYPLLTEVRTVEFVGDASWINVNEREQLEQLEKRMGMRHGKIDDIVS